MADSPQSPLLGFTSQPAPKPMKTKATRKGDEPAPGMAETDQEICAEMRQRFDEYTAADSEFLKKAENALDFLGGDVWRDFETNKDWGKALQDISRTAISVDLVSPAVDLIVNQVRINKPTANFIPVADGADEATADVREGLYRNEDRECNAATARETAYQLAVSCGRGYARVVIENEPGLNFDRRSALRRITDLRSVAYDKSAMEFDCSDMGWSIFFEDVPVAQFRADYGEEPDATGNGLPEPQRQLWFKKGYVRVADYYRTVWTTRKIAKLPPGATLKGLGFCYLEDVPEGVHPVAIAPKRECKVEWYKMTGAGVLDRPEWKVPFNPLVVYIGREKIRGTKPIIHSGMVEPAIGVSRVHNFAESRLVDEGALSPLPHVFSAVGQFTPAQERIINTINSHPWANVQWTPTIGKDGQQLPPPQWVTFAPNIQALVAMAEHAKDNLQRIMNTFAPQLGQMQGDQSGRAIREVKDQGDVVHAAFSDNADRALLYEAKIRNALMDVLYSERQAITITQPDDTIKQVLINQKYTDESGEEQHHLFGQGRYAVAITTGPSYPTRAAEASGKLLDAAKIMPEIGAKAPDLIVKTLGLPGGLGDKIAERLAPPGADNNLPPQVQAMMQQGQQQIQFLTGLVQELKNGIHIKAMELASRERIAEMQGRVQTILGILKEGSAGNQVALQAEMDALKHLSTINEQPLAASPELQDQPAAPPPGQPAPQPAAPAASPNSAQ